MVSLHVPLTPETRGLIKKETIEKMKFGAMLINTSRGALVDARAAIGARYTKDGSASWFGRLRK